MMNLNNVFIFIIFFIRGTTSISCSSHDDGGPCDDPIFINEQLCEDDVVVVADGNWSMCHETFHPDGTVCANAGQTNEAYCSYDIGPKACAYCGDDPYANCDVFDFDRVGDGYCDRDLEYNNGECGFDGGDCCESTCVGWLCGSNGYDCRDPADPNHATNQNCIGDPLYLGDGACDDILNSAECNYDGGDCCESTCVLWYCGYKGYDCKDPDAPDYDEWRPPYNCSANFTFLHDGLCDSEYNTEECVWDGGDCCESTCSLNAIYECGRVGYDCQDPNAFESHMHVIFSAEQNSKSKHSVRFDSLSTGGGGVSILSLVLISVFSILFCIVSIFCVYKRMHNRVQTNTKQMTEMVEATMEQESDAEPEATDNVTVCTDTNDTPVPPQNQTKI